MRPSVLPEPDGVELGAGVGLGAGVELGTGVGVAALDVGVGDGEPEFAGAKLSAKNAPHLLARPVIVTLVPLASVVVVVVAVVIATGYVVEPDVTVKPYGVVDAIVPVSVVVGGETE